MSKAHASQTEPMIYDAVLVLVENPLVEARAEGEVVVMVVSEEDAVWEDAVVDGDAVDDEAVVEEEEDSEDEYVVELPPPHAVVLHLYAAM